MSTRATGPLHMPRALNIAREKLLGICMNFGSWAFALGRLNDWLSRLDGSATPPRACIRLVARSA